MLNNYFPQLRLSTTPTSRDVRTQKEETTQMRLAIMIIYNVTSLRALRVEKLRIRLFGAPSEQHSRTGQK